MDPDKLFEFYLAVRSEQVQWMNRHGDNLRHYLVLVMAILAVTLGAVYQFRGDIVFTLAASLGFVVNILLCCVAALACDRFYQRFLEAVTMTAKLEAFLGLDGPRPTIAQPKQATIRFPKDAYLLPERWLKNRHEETAAEFVRDNMCRGANRLARVTMGILAVMNFVLLLAVIIIIRCG